MNVREFLRERKVEFEILPHSPTYEAQRLAQAVAVTGYHVAKTVLVDADGQRALFVVPAAHAVDFDLARRVLQTDSVELASEKTLTETFPDCEVGAVPPFGSPYGVPTFLDEALTEGEIIVFEGNRHDEAYRMQVADYRALERPTVVRVSHLPQ